MVIERRKILPNIAILTNSCLKLLASDTGKSGSQGLIVFKQYK
jgi:hypothetical protein